MKRAARFFGLTMAACGMWTSGARAEVLAEYIYSNDENFNPATQGWMLAEGTEEDVNFFSSGGVSLLIIEENEANSGTTTNVHFTHTVPTSAFFGAWSFTGNNRFAANSKTEFGMAMFVDDGTNLWHMTWINTANDARDGIWMGGDPSDAVETSTQMWVETVGEGPGGTLENKPEDGFFDWALVDSDGAGGAPPKIQLEGQDLVLLAPVAPAASRFPAGTVGWGSLNPFERGYFQTTHMVFEANPAVEPSLDGDFNADDVVDGTDLLVFQRNLGAVDETSLNGNGDGMNGVDAGDLALFKTNFGMTASVAAASIPEPASAALLCIGALAWSSKRRKMRN
jgi:hypothetical protein